MSKPVVYKGRESVRAAMRILNHSYKFIILAEQLNGNGEPELRLHTSGYPHESLVANDLMKVGVGLLKQHKDEMARLKAEMEAAGILPVQPEPAPETPEPEEGRQVGYAGLVLPTVEVAPPAFGQPEGEARQ